MKRTYRSAVATAAGVLGAVALAAPATATTKLVCTFSGDAKIVDKHDPNIGMRAVGGEGKFTFQELMNLCVGDADKDGIPEIEQFGFTATGWYANVVCGTGKALGTIVDIRNFGTPTLARTLEGRKFGIEFLADQGIFKWHDAAKGVPLDKENPFADDKPSDDKDYDVAGYLLLGEPSGKFGPPEPTEGECRKAFSLTGSLLVHFEG